MTRSSDPVVWVVYVGEGGEYLPTFNTQHGPFPPEPGTEGHVTIGWEDVGNLLGYAGRYPAFVEQMRISYPHAREQSFSRTCGAVWNFGFVMKPGDWVVSPSWVHGVQLFGEIIGPYAWRLPVDIKTAGVGPERLDAPIPHRPVRWNYVLRRDDPRYARFSGLGRLAVFKLGMTLDELLDILQPGQDAAD